MNKVFWFKVSSKFSSREVFARSKKEARIIFRKMVPGANNEKLTVC